MDPDHVYDMSHDIFTKDSILGTFEIYLFMQISVTDCRELMDLCKEI